MAGIVTFDLDSPCVSVVMPVNNEEQTLAKNIETVLKQPLVAELICVDYCSEDAAAVVLESYAGRDPRMRVLRHPFNR